MNKMKKNQDLSLVWKNKNFIALFFGRLISSIGDNIYLLGLPWLALHITGSSLVLSSIMATEYVSRLVSAFFGGVVADKFNRKKIMVTASFLQGTLVLSIPLIYHSGYFSLWMLYGYAALINIVGGFYFNTEKAFLPSLFPKHLYTAMNSQYQLINTFSKFIGPSLAGALIAIFGPVNVLTVDAATFGVLVLALLSIKVAPSTQDKAKDEGFYQSVKEGFIFLKNNMVLTKVAIGSLVLNISLGPVLALLVFFSANHLQASSFETGVIYSCGGIGGTIIAFFASSIHKKWNRAKVFLWNTICLGIGIIALSFSPHWVFASLSFLLIMAMIMLYNINYNTVVQEIVPDHFRGRVSSTLFLVSQLALPASMTISGVISEGTDVSSIFFTLGVAMILSGVLFYKIVYSRYREIYIPQVEQLSQ